MSKPKLATVWLDGCSGCHMSILDTDERLLDLAALVDIVYSPLVDAKVYPEDVDIALIEGSVSYDEDIERLHHFRSRTKTIIALGDCAVAGNVPTLRNPYSVEEVLNRAYIEKVTENKHIPVQMLPQMLPYVRPIHEIIPVDVFVQGCPPSADTIFHVLTELLAGRTPDLTKITRPGA